MNGAAARVEPFYAVEINRQANERARRGLPVIHMEVGQPSAGAPQSAIEAGHRALTDAHQGYWESGALKERIAALYGERYQLGPAASQVILSMGASAALVMALALLFERGSQVALARPGYPAHRNVLHALGLEPLELDCGPETRFQPTAAMIAALEPAPAGLILTSPSNPTGTMLERAELAAIAAVCRRRGIRILSDETYHGITFGRPAHSMLEFDPDAVVVNSFSKYWCMTGWRLGLGRRTARPCGCDEPLRRQHVPRAADAFAACRARRDGCDDGSRGACRDLREEPEAADGGAAGARHHAHGAGRRRVLRLCRYRPPDRRFARLVP